MRKKTVSLACVTLLSLGYGGKLWGQDDHAPAEGREAALIAALKSTASENEKADACRQLGCRIGTKASVAPLAALLTDEKLSHMARYALEPISDPSVDDALRKAADKLDGRNLAGVIGSIGVRHDVNAIELLGKRLKDRDVDVAPAARLLGSLGTAATGDALLNEPPGTSAGNRGPSTKGCSWCGEALSHDLPAAALAIYDRLDQPQLPQYVRDSAARRARMLRQEKGQTI